MALARNMPILGVPTLDILAAGQPMVDMPLAAVLRAGRGRIAVNWYKPDAGIKMRRDPVVQGGRDPGWTAHGPAVVTTIEALAKSIAKPCLVAGELDLEERQRLSRKRVNVVLAPPSRCVRRPAILAEIGWKRYREGLMDNPATLSPIYLHANEPIEA
jgi:tRNA threonylcarbamoyladenosine biosynthesis protein TsaB